MASLTSSSPSKIHLHSHALTLQPLTHPDTQSPADDELTRGRKRRRSSTASQSSQLPSNNIRGRGRRRSLSLSSSQPQTTSQDTHQRTASPHSIKTPGKKYQKTYLSLLREEKRRSQSPSRSRSFGHEGVVKPRRRQRTRSRSRSHRKETRSFSEGDAEPNLNITTEEKCLDDVAVED